MSLNIRLLLLFIFFSPYIFAQNFGVRFGVNSATPTGNNDEFQFDFLNSFSIGYQAGVVGVFELSNIIILKPALTFRNYSFNDKLLVNNNFYNIEQSHTVICGDLNFDIEITNQTSLIFGMGVDYLMFMQTFKFNNDFEQSTNIDLGDWSMDQLMDPFSNIGICFQIGRRLLLDIEYKHLLDNWGTGNVLTEDQLINSSNGSVKLHLLNFTTTFLF